MIVLQRHENGVILLPMDTALALAERTGTTIVMYADGWEVDWGKRRRHGTNPYVWARRPQSCQKRARDWHWAQHGTLVKRGIAWVSEKERPRGYKTSSGYKIKPYGEMSGEERELATACDLWVGRSRGQQRGVLEHRLVAAKKYGAFSRGLVVRHLNGDKVDNRPENLLLGTKKENSNDHRTDRILMMYWRERALEAVGADVAQTLISGIDAVKACLLPEHP